MSVTWNAGLSGARWQASFGTGKGGICLSVQEACGVRALEVVPDNTFEFQLTPDEVHQVIGLLQEALTILEEPVPLPSAVIVDIDGTLALRTGDRSPFDWGRVGEDVLNPPVVDLVRMVHEARRHEIILMSGRDEECRPETEAWLEAHRIPWTELHMRPAGNNEKDSVVKERLFREHVEPHYDVEFVLDDRNQVVKMWRAIGLTVFQVAEGDF